jgi:flagella basal body P-ring formation protein FlgA
MMNHRKRHRVCRLTLQAIVLTSALMLTAVAAAAADRVALIVEPIERAIEAHIRYRMPWNQADVTVRDIHIGDGIELPGGKLTYRIVPARNEDYLGRTLLAVQLLVNGEPARKIWAQAYVSVMTDVVMAVRPLGKRMRIDPDDVVLVRRDLAELAPDTIRRMDEAVGHRTTRTIYPNSVLEAGMITVPPVIRRGDIVRITASAAGMTITATGMAKQQGRIGEAVRVVNTDSNRIITARVTGPGAVAVDF